MVVKLRTRSEGRRRKDVERFVSNWEGRDFEKSDSNAFWLALLDQVLGIPYPAQYCSFEKQTPSGGWIDVWIPEAKTLVEQKSGHVDLDKPDVRRGEHVTPYQQAKAYADELSNLERPNFIVVCNFNTFRIHNLNNVNAEHDYVEFKLSELTTQAHLLNFLVDSSQSRSARELKVSIDAGALIGKLYEELLARYVDPDNPESQHALNVLCVRLVFCLFAEDAGVFPKDSFWRYLSSYRAEDMRDALMSLFRVLDTPYEQRSPYLNEKLTEFPYVNGGLFAGEVEIPNFTPETRDLLINEVSRNTDWAQISPTIFGGVFESTLNPETRRSGGMHYTSPENIHKVIDPLFLDSLKAELDAILQDPQLTARRRRNRLTRYQAKLGELTFFDPSCGSGNFLTETYIELRRLENRVLEVLNHGQTMFDFVDQDIDSIQVSLNQFYGIEINDFAVSVARTALWIAQLQANIETESIIQRDVADLPLHDSSLILHGNALQEDWAELLAPANCDYILGNPPFIGYSNHSAEQKKDRELVFGKKGGLLDYVAGWYAKAAQYMEGTSIEAAFVSTNSITQGQQVTPLWKPLFEKGVKINFAHRTFTWENEAADQAHVHVVIVGFSYRDRERKMLYTYSRTTLVGETEAANINGYLTDAPNVFIDRRSKPLTTSFPMLRGNQPTDGGNLLMTAGEVDELLRIEPSAAKWIRKYSMGAEFISGKDRYCLWLVGITPQELRAMPAVMARVRAVKEMRESSKKAATQKKAETPWLFDEIRYTGDGTYIGVPKVSSERRRYIPMGFVTDGMIPGDKLYFIPTDSLYQFGVLMSQFHNAWMRIVGGRLKSDYSYANTIIYNNFVWPEPTDGQRARIEQYAQAVLDAHAKYQADGSTSLADLYDPDNDWLYPELTNTHRELDRAVEQAYGVDFNGDENKIVAHLFKLYRQATV